ncbi:MAG TPA: CHAD domain-containing protein [Solirubrobacteraceae bacterium]
MAAIGLGVLAAALARVELERRAAGKSRKRPRSPAPRSKLQRMTIAQLDLAIALLQDNGPAPPERTVHETRKALKRARALVRLQRTELGRKRYARENAALRDAGRLLAGARDAEVVLDALDALIARHPDRLARSPGVSELRARLADERERARAHTERGGPARAGALAQLHAVRARLERAQPARRERKTARAGLRRIYREGRERRRRALRTPNSRALHEWRKRVKDLRYAAEMLKLRPLERAADRLGETLGEEHDLALLAERVRLHRDCLRGEKATRKTLVRLIARKRERLRRRALREGKRLYRRKPKRFVRRQLDP